MLANQEILKRRQVIQYAFADELSAEQIQQAIALWEELFYDSPTFISKIFQFTNKLEDKLNLTPSKRLKLMTNLVSSFNLLKDSVIIDPQDIEAEAEPMSDDCIIFNALLSEATTYLQQHHSEDIVLLKQYLLEDIYQLSFKAKVYQALLLWCQHIDQNSVVIREEVNKRQMAEFIDFLYEELCDVLGAKQTDLLFSSIVSQCEQLPAAKRFSPHDLL